MLTRLSLILALMFAGIAASAQNATAPSPAQSDLDGDGLAETFILLYPTEGVTHLLISPVNQPTLLAQNFVWRGGLGQEPNLSVAPNGSLRLTSGNQAVGRNRWLLIQTIAYRDGAYRLVGLTYNWFDTLDLNNGGTCDLNLLTGTGERRFAGRSEETYTSDLTAVPINQWTSDSLLEGAVNDIPVMCGL